MEDYTRMQKDLDLQSVKMGLIQKELQNVKLQHELFKNQLTPRGGAPTDRSIRTDRRPAMYHGRGDDIAKLQIYYGFGERDKMTLPYDRRPDMYCLELEHDKEATQRTPREKSPGRHSQTDRKNKAPKDKFVSEELDRRPEIYHGLAERAKDDEDCSPRRAEVRKEEIYLKDRKNEQGYGKYDFEEIRRNEREKKYSYFDSTAINPQDYERRGIMDRQPWNEPEKLSDPGWLAFMRFRDSDFGPVKILLQGVETVLRSTGGYLLGKALKEKIRVYKNPSWREIPWIIARRQDGKDFMSTDNGIAMFWFTSMNAAKYYFECKQQKRFKEPSFDSYEAFCVPLNSAVSAKTMNAFLFIEFLHAHQYPLGTLSGFEAELRQEMLKCVPGCQPFVVSSVIRSDQLFNPGTMVLPRSKFYVCMFASQKDINEVWKNGMIEDLRLKWNLSGAMHVASFTISELR